MKRDRRTNAGFGLLGLLALLLSTTEIRELGFDPPGSHRSMEGAASQERVDLQSPATPLLEMSPPGPGATGPAPVGSQGTAPEPKSKTSLVQTRSPWATELYFDPRLNREVTVVKGEAMVRFNKDLTQEDIGVVLKELDATVLQKNPQLGFYRLRLPATTTVSEFVTTASQKPNLQVIEPNFTVSALATVNDPFLESQWAVHTIGADMVWEKTTGVPGVVVAVLDTGIDEAHPELKSQILPGYDFVSHDLDPADDHGHGTEAAGIIAAEANNGLGIAGVASGCRLLPVKVLNSGARARIPT